MTARLSPATELMHAVLDGEASDSEARRLETLLAADPALRAEFFVACGWPRGGA